MYVIFNFNSNIYIFDMYVFFVNNFKNNNFKKKYMYMYYLLIDFNFLNSFLRIGFRFIYL